MPAVEGSAGYVLECIGEETADYRAGSCAEIPESCARWLFVLFVPLEVVLDGDERYWVGRFTIVVMSMRDGATADSKQPSSTLVVMRPA